MTDMTTKLALPYIMASQAQKEITHNMALNMLDLFVQPIVEAVDLSAPPAEPGEGQAWIVASGATGDWAGQEDNIAHWLGGAWSFYAPVEGMHFQVRDLDMLTIFRSGMWRTGAVNGLEISVNGQQVVGDRGAAIADVSGGQVIDSEARTTINTLLQVCRAHGLIES